MAKVVRLLSKEVVTTKSMARQSQSDPCFSVPRKRRDEVRSSCMSRMSSMSSPLGRLCGATVLYHNGNMLFAPAEPTRNQLFDGGHHSK